MDLDFSQFTFGYLMLSTVYSTVGLGVFIYGKNQQRAVPLLVGLALMVVPFLLTNLWLMSAASLGLLAVAYFLRDRD